MVSQPPLPLTVKLQGISISMETRQCPEPAGSISPEREVALDFASSRQALDTLSRQLSGECSVISGTSVFNVLSEVLFAA